MGWQCEFENVLMGRKTPAKRVPVLFAGLDEFRQALELHPADRCLGIERLEVVAQVAVCVLVVISSRQFTQLPIEPFVAGVVHTTGTPAVAAPVAEAFGDHLQLMVAHDVHRPAFPHREVVGWVEALGADVTPGARPADHTIRAFIQARAVLAEAQALRQWPRH